jgi:hypothetical protein
MATPLQSWDLCPKLKHKTSLPLENVLLYPAVHGDCRGCAGVYGARGTELADFKHDLGSLDGFFA